MVKCGTEVCLNIWILVLNKCPQFVVIKDIHEEFYGNDFGFVFKVDCDLELLLAVEVVSRCWKFELGGWGVVDMLRHIIDL